MFAPYADPAISFGTEVVAHDHKEFVVIRIDEFRDAPIICRRTFNAPDGTVILREGACYVRPRRKPETTEIPTYADMRDLIDLAVQKGLRRYVELTEAAGLNVRSSVSKQSDDQRFKNQRKTLDE